MNIHVMRHYIDVMNDSLLCEAAITMPWGQRVIVLKNPSDDPLLNALNRSRSKHLRGLIHGLDVVWWDGHDAIHGDIAAIIGHDDYFDDRLDLRNTDDEARLDFNEDWTPERLATISGMRRVLQSTRIFIEEQGNGWIPAPEWMSK